MANERLPGIWRLREMRTFIADIRRDPPALLGVAELLERLGRQEGNRWIDLIAEGIAALADELGSQGMPVPDLVEWFGEWARDTRGQQRGLLLLTAHRAKGLEFDHVVILDGDWLRLSRGEDRDAPRRLYYVAMTRARRSLALIAWGQHPFLEGTAGAVLRRKVVPDLRAPSDGARRYLMPDPTMVDLSWAGRCRDGHPALAAIAGLKTGDPLTLSGNGKHWMLHTASGQSVGRMSSRFRIPDGVHFLRGEVGAVLSWSKRDNDESYHASLKRDAWETVLPELVFAPDTNNR